MCVPRMTTVRLANRYGLAEIIDAPIRRRQPMLNTPINQNEIVPEMPTFIAVRIRRRFPNIPLNVVDGLPEFPEFAEFPEFRVFPESPDFPEFREFIARRNRRRRSVPNVLESIRELFSNIVLRLLYPRRWWNSIMWPPMDLITFDNKGAPLKMKPLNITIHIKYI